MARFDDDDEEDEFGESNQLPSARPAEDLLIRVSHKFVGEKILCTTLGRGQLAGLLANLDSKRHVTCCFGDLFAAQISRKFFGEISRNIQVVCDPEFPGDEYDLAALPVGKHGEAELMRDYLQAAVLKLKVGGQLWTAVDNEEDRWLIQEMKKLFKKVTVEEIPGGIVYHAVREEKPPRIRDFSADFAIRDGERLQKFISRPGVFNHRQVDLGARALIETMRIDAGDHIIDLGCGVGVCGLTATARAGDLRLCSVDSNPRAIECTVKNAAANEMKNVEAILDCDGSHLQEDGFQVALANPPYFSRFRISRIFVNNAHRCLKAGGRLYLVTKIPDWYRAYLPIMFGKVTEHECRGYIVFEAEEPDKTVVMT